MGSDMKLSERLLAIADSIPESAWEGVPRNLSEGIDAILAAKDTRIAELEAEVKQLKSQIADFEVAEWAQTTVSFVKDVPNIFAGLVDNAKDAHITRLQAAVDGTDHDIATMILAVEKLKDHAITKNLVLTFLDALRARLTQHADLISPTAQKGEG